MAVASNEALVPIIVALIAGLSNIIAARIARSGGPDPKRPKRNRPRRRSGPGRRSVRRRRKTSRQARAPPSCSSDSMRTAEPMASMQSHQRMVPRSLRGPPRLACLRPSGRQCAAPSARSTRFE